MESNENNELSDEMLHAARTLGSALNDSPEMQAYHKANQAARSEPELRRLEAEVQRLYDALIARQQAGEILSPQEINDFYSLRQQVAQHPLILERDQRLRELKALFELAGSAMSSILTIDYSSMVLEDD